MAANLVPPLLRSRVAPETLAAEQRRSRQAGCILNRTSGSNMHRTILLSMLACALCRAQTGDS
jgi:hypothetical protein